MMDPRSSNGFQLENEPTWELGANQNQNLSDEHSSQGLETIQVENPVPSVSPSNNSSDGILRYIDQILMEDDLEQHIMLQESSDFRAKERSLYEAIGQKYPPSPQQESSSLINAAQYVVDDDANNKDEVIIEKTSHSEAIDNNFPMQEFDESVWMYTAEEKLAAEMANMGIMRSNVMQPDGGAKIRTKKRNKKRNNREKDEVVDLRALLIDCSKSVSLSDRLSTNDLLRKIRQHSSPYGDGIQRLAHYFADGLEARLAGITHKITDSSDYLRAYHMSYSPSMTRKIFSFASNEMIAIRSEKATSIHVIDFGILYGIQWPSFIRRMARREGGPPKKLRITGIEFPQVVEIIEDTGSRLASYAEALGVPFEYKAIAQEWETIKIEDLKIEKDEFVAVVCSLRSMRLLDETIHMAESPRSMCLKLIREINPEIFVHMIINGAFNQPFFTYRFRDFLLHFLAVFDMLETLLPRDQPERVMIERDLVGEDILNVIACEGPERVLRPETYRQWQVRNLKAGFKKVPFERKLIDAITCKTSNLYHKDYLIFEENQWMLMSWKGRAMFAISCWQPVAA